MGHRKVTAEGEGARYRRNVQQYLFILICTYGVPGLLNGAKMREEVKYQIEGEEH